MKPLVSQQEEDDSAGIGVDDITITAEDYEDAAEPLPNSAAYMGGEPSGQLQHPDHDERRERFKSRLKTGYAPPSDKVRELPASGSFPKLDEWLDFFSRVVVGMLTDLAVEFCFRGVDEELLTEREVQAIKLDKEERDRIAKPMAEYAYKNKFTRKHGREIIGLAGSIDAVLQLGIWYARMSKIAAKYQAQAGNPRRQHRPFRQSRAAREHTSRQQQRNTQRVVIVEPEEVSEDERTGPGATQPSPNGHEREWRPDVAGPVYNPGG